MVVFIELYLIPFYEKAKMQFNLHYSLWLTISYRMYLLSDSSKQLIDNKLGAVSEG